MSSFHCPSCGKFLEDNHGKGYVTGCSHFPLSSKVPEVPQFLKDIFSK